MSDYLYEPQARSLRAQVAIAVWAAGLVAMRVVIDAAWVVLALLALPLVPAIIEQLRNPRRWLRLTDKAVIWHDGFSEQEVLLSRIEEVRLDTRLDMSVRARLTLHSKTKLRLPPTVTPRSEILEAELQARGVKVSRQHFRVF